MKKKICLIGLLALTLLSCNKTKPKFDDDFIKIVENLKNEDYAFNKLIVSKDSEYVFSSPNIPLNIRAYYKAYEDQFRYIFVLNFDYLDREVNDIRLALVSLNSTNSIVSQVGFMNNKKTISSFENKQENKYKGIQIFLSPFEINKSKIRFYFEYNNQIGSYYQFDEVKEYVV